MSCKNFLVPKVLNELIEFNVKNMKLGLFVSEYRIDEELLKRLKAEKLGIFLVGNGIYHAVLKEHGNPSFVLGKEGAKFYVLKEDLLTRGFKENEVAPNVEIITYSDLVDLIMGEYEKLAWL